MTAAESNVPASGAGDAGREARWAEAMEFVGGRWHREDMLAAVIALADEERAADRAEIERLTDTVNVQGAFADEAAGWRHRAESAEAEVARLSAELQAAQETLGRVEALHRRVDRPAVPAMMHDGFEVAPAQEARTDCSCGRLWRTCPTVAALAGSSPSTAGSDTPCRCGHAKAEHPAPDGDTYCRRCSCAHYLPTVADMMRDEAAVGRLLAAVDGSAGSDGEGDGEGATDSRASALPIAGPATEAQCPMTDDGTHRDGGVDPDWNERICSACGDEYDDAPAEATSGGGDRG